MLIGGVSALLLQTLHPLAMAGVAEHSGYREDPLGRLRRTATFVGTTTFGTVAEAEAAIAQVHRVHRRVQGHGARRAALLGGRPRAGDLHPRGRGLELPGLGPALRAPAAHTRGVRPLLRGGGPRGARPRGQLGAPLGAPRWRATCCGCGPSSTPARRPARPRDWLLRGVARRPGERAVYSLVLAAAVGILPSWARRELGLSLAGPLDLLVDTAAVAPLTAGSSAAVRWMVDPTGLSGGQTGPGRGRPSTTTTWPVT